MPDVFGSGLVVRSNRGRDAETSIIRAIIDRFRARHVKQDLPILLGVIFKTSV